MGRYFNAPPRRLLGKFVTEKILIEKHFTFIKCAYNDRCLTCKGTYKPTNTLYEYKVVYDGISNPTVTVVSPCIDFNHDIHMYSDTKGLCLHYPKDKSWTPQMRLYSTIIPWIHEWFVYYELYLITGRWEHPYVDHKTIKQITPKISVKS